MGENNPADSFLSDIHSSTASILSNTSDIFSTTTGMLSSTTSIFTSIIPDVNLMNMLTVSNISWVYKEFKELSIHELYDLLRLRAEIFVVEQNCPYQDVDGLDQQCTHILGYDFIKNKLVAYCRLIPTGLKYPNSCAIGRVIVSKEYRKYGVGKLLITNSIKKLNEKYPGINIELSGQSYLLRFYESFGFTVVGEEYEEDGIPHYHMILDYKSNKNIAVDLMNVFSNGTDSLLSTISATTNIITTSASAMSTPKSK